MISVNEDKLGILVGLTKDLENSDISANNIVQTLNNELDGRGGGKQLMAFSGTKNVNDITRIKKIVLEHLKANITN